MGDTLSFTDRSLELAQAVISMRRRREALFGAEYFSDPAWDMLLNLYFAELRGQRTQVKSVGVNAGIPATTALRWIALLEQRGMIEREADPRDRRRILIKLSPEARAGVKELIDYLASGIAEALVPPDD